MNFLKAVEIAEKSKKIVGKQFKGGIIDEIIIRPTDPKMCEGFEKEYICSLNAQTSIVPYMESDVDIAVVIDKERIRKDGCFIYISLYDLKDTFDVVE